MHTDYEYLAQSLAALAGVPVRLYINETFQHLYHHTKFKPDLAILEEPNIFQSTQNVSYYMDANFLYYGLFRAKKDGVALLIGPIAQMPIDQKAARNILRHMGESSTRVTELQNYFSTIVAYPLRNFLQILCTINFFINGDQLDVSQLLLQEEENIVPPQKTATQSHNTKSIHNTLELEQRLLSCVEHGKTEELKTLFQQPSEGRPGIMAADAIRQQKNLFICTITLVTRAAIKGGLDVETAFTLSDMYIQKAELITRYEKLTTLNAQMVLDFTTRVQQVKCGIHHSELVRKARDYILTHIDEPITTAALAREVGLNRTYLCTHFAEETSMTVNQFITQTKIEEAKRLMDITKKSIAEIAESLGFSSQSYFQKVFRKHCGITPGEYRQGAGPKHPHL